VTGRKHGDASRLTVYVDARTGRVLTTKEHVLEGTGTGNWEGSVSIPTTGSGTSFSMTNSNASTLKCQNASGNVTFTGTDDAWGNGSGTDRETGCVDAFYSAEKMRQMMSSWLGRNGMNGSGGWVPIRVGLNDVNAYYDGTQVQIGHRQGTNEWIGSLDVVAHEFGHGVDDKTPGGISGNGSSTMSSPSALWRVTRLILASRASVSAAPQPPRQRFPSTSPLGCHATSSTSTGEPTRTSVSGSTHSSVTHPAAGASISSVTFSASTTIGAAGGC